jgi:glycerol uptake facilitator-like aquaporin
LVASSSVHFDRIGWCHYEAVEGGVMRRIVSEFLGTLILVVAVLGPAFMASNLEVSAGFALVLAAVTVLAVLFLLITALGPISGAHLNPAVSLAFLLHGRLAPRWFAGYLLAQTLGAIAGTLLTSLMFSASPLVLSSVDRGGWGVLVSEWFTTLGLVALILLLLQQGRGVWIPVSVALWIGAGHIFSSSTSFANPAVTLGRMVTDAANGIAPAFVPGFIAAQIVGAVSAVVVLALLGGALRSPARANPERDS